MDLLIDDAVDARDAEEAIPVAVRIECVGCSGGPVSIDGSTGPASTPNASTDASLGSSSSSQETQSTVITIPSEAHRHIRRA
jgi:hypothetical protein